MKRLIIGLAAMLALTVQPEEADAKTDKEVNGIECWIQKETPHYQQAPHLLSVYFWHV